MPANGDVSKKFAVYRTLCCDAEIVIGIGVFFPDCPNHVNLPTEWREVEEANPETYKPKPSPIKPLGNKATPGKTT